MITGTAELGEALSISRRLECAPDPLHLFQALRGDGPALLLESADAVEKHALRSILVPRTALRIEAREGMVRCMLTSANGRNALVYLTEQLQAHLKDKSDEHALFDFSARPDPSEDDLSRLRAPSPLAVLRVLSSSLQVLGDPGQPALSCAGVFAYDLIDRFETLPAPHVDPLSYPDFVFFLAESIITVDHRARTCQLRALVFGGDKQATTKAYHDAVERLGQQVLSCQQVASQHPAPAVGAAPLPARGDDSHTAEQALNEKVAQLVEQAEHDLNDEAYAERVRQLQQRIVAGDIFQVVPSRGFQLPCPEPIASYRQLKTLNPSPYMFYVDAGDHVLFGASPETCVQVQSKREQLQMRIRPIAGTRRRGRRADGSIDRDLDNRLETELKLHHKEIAEHMMLVDLARNDVARVCQPGSRHAERLLSSDRYAHVIHLVSEIRGTLRDGLDALHAYQASLNMGTLVGAPKVRAAQLLREMEAAKRGPYGGAVGYLGSDGSLDTAIVIRSALVRDGGATVRAGAGVVHDSDPLAEATETRLKARSVLNAIARATLQMNAQEAV